MQGLPSQIGPYRIVGKLGEGGMGTVYEAVHEAIERRVAIKVLHLEYARNTEFCARFFNELREEKRRRKVHDPQPWESLRNAARQGMRKKERLHCREKRRCPRPG